VGRSEELGRVLAALDRAAAGSGGALLLAGEAGIGKSRLAAEALALARQRGFVTLEGAAYPMQADLAYAPVLELLGPFLAGLEPGRRNALVGGLLDLGRLFAGLHLLPSEPLGDAALERTRLFEAVSRLVERVAAERPVALLVDDLHWADAASLELLHYLARGLGTRRALLLGTYRLDEARTHPGLRTLVRSLQRLGLAEELHVGGLGPEAVAALARALLGGEPPVELLGVLRARAAGTPLFVTALVRGLRETGGLFRSGGAWVLRSGSPTAVPPVARDLVLARLEWLDPGDRALLELVAVAGDAAAPPVLGRVGGPGTQELEGALGRLCESGLLVEEPVGPDLLYRAAHPLIAEVAYGELPETRRRRLHADVAAALEALRPADLQRLAHHYRGAVGEADPGRALEVLRTAGRRAEELHADAEAADLFAAALALARPDRPAMVAELLERLGHARSRAGQLEAAVAAWSEAAAALEQAGDRPAVSRLRGLLALAEWDRGRFEAAEAQLAAAFRAIEDAHADRELAELHHIRLRLLVRQGDVARVEQAAVALLGLAEPRGTRPAVSAHLARADAAFLRGHFAAAREHGLQALAVAERAGLGVLAAQAHRHLAMTAVNVGDHRLARDHARADLTLARQSGSPSLELGGRFFVVAIDLVSDDWEEALGGADELLAHGHRVGHARSVATALAGRAFVVAHRGRPEEAARCLAEAREVYGAAAAADRHIFTVVELAEATAALAAGDPRRGEERATAAVATPTVLPCLGLAVLGEAQVAAGDPAGGLDSARRLAGLGPDAPWPAACASRVEGLARAALGERSAALACLRRAADRLDGLGLPFQAARAWLDWAEVAAASPSGGADQVPVGRADAVEAARRSLATFDRLGARPSADRARRLLRALGERPAAPPRAATGELSERELQVVRLVAAGLSNAEIAGRLFISPRTVTTHLQHVYARLGVGSRTALTRWVLERGLGAEDT
jgi:DNA-binding CsgD family transcriptional regulator/tetratricopeptide (TPR) repeat protein